MTATAFELLSQPIRHALWDMQWRELRPIQVDAIQTLLTTEKDLLITARTASGKTEAAFLPILSRLHESPGASVGAMYVGPLKALINDQFQRLERLCERAEIPVHRWHGDVDGGQKEKLLKAPRGVILITPESLESFFVNRPGRLAGLFADLRFVVIDEIHALVGRERGLQLRSQLYRLRQYVRQDFRLLGLSATVGDRIDFYRRWMRPENPENVAHIEDEQETKRVQYGIYAYDTKPSEDPTETEASKADEDRTANSDDPVPDVLVADILRNFGGKKNLIFCNNRGGVEWLADGLNDACRRQGRPEEFLVHHGSISKELRFATEEEMRGARPATAVCSATLELGIDIGSVKTVGQLGACWSVNSLVQRLGRSGRRDDEPHCMRVMLPTRRQQADADLVVRLYPELLQAIALTELMLQKWYEPPTVSEHDRSTLVQQALSVLAEHGGVRAQTLAERLVTSGAFRETEMSEFAELLRGLGRAGLMEQMQDGLLLLTPKGEQIVHDRDFYSAFVTPQELTVRSDGRTIGTLSAVYLPRPEDHFLLAGRRWQVCEVDLKRGEVLVRPAAGRKPPKYYGSVGEVHHRIHEEMKRVVSSDQEYAYLNPLAKELLHSARVAYRQAMQLDDNVLDLGNGNCLWFTWAGTRIQRTLLIMADQVGLDCSDERIAIRFRASPQQVADILGRSFANVVDPNDVPLEIEATPWRKFDDYVSPPLLQEAFIRDRLDLAGAREAVAQFTARYPSSNDDVIQASVGNCSHDSNELEDFSDADGLPRDGYSAFPDGPMDACEFVAFDLETTGLHPLWERIVEIAAVRFNTHGCELDRFQSLVDPGKPIPTEATKIHGITDDMVRGQPTISDVLSRFVSFLGGGSTVLIAHNASFDRNFLKSAAAVNGLLLPDLPVIDTLVMARATFPAAPNHRLPTLLELIGRSSERAHRAASDADSVRLLFEHFLKRRPLRIRSQLYEVGNAVPLSDRSEQPPELPPGFEDLALAIEKRRPIQILYRGGRVSATMREVTPIQIIESAGRHYLSAICGFDGNTKLFRFDRIQKLIVID